MRLTQCIVILIRIYSEISRTFNKFLTKDGYDFTFGQRYKYRMWIREVRNFTARLVLVFVPFTI